MGFDLSKCQMQVEGQVILGSPMRKKPLQGYLVYFHQRLNSNNNHTSLSDSFQVSCFYPNLDYSRYITIIIIIFVLQDVVTKDVAESDKCMGNTVESEEHFNLFSFLNSGLINSVHRFDNWIWGIFLGGWEGEGYLFRLKFSGYHREHDWGEGTAFASCCMHDSMWCGCNGVQFWRLPSHRSP